MPVEGCIQLSLFGKTSLELCSSDKRDYLAVLKSFAGTEVSMPASGQWADAGMVRGRRCDLAWRILDAQYWSKPKLAHRERIFLVADFTGQRAGEILFNTRSMHTDSRLCSASGLSAAEDRRDASFEAGRQIPVILPFYGFKMREQPQTEIGNSSSGALESGQMCFRLF